MRSFKAVFVAMAAVITVVAIFVLMSRTSREQAVGNDKHKDDTRQSAGVELNGEKFVVVPSTVSENRVANTGIPKKGSEDMTHLLKPPNVAARPRRFDEDRDYRPDDKIEWVIDVEFEGAPVLQRSRVLELFDKSWRGENGKPVLFGWSPEDKHWTYLVAAGVPETYTKLAFGWKLLDPVAKTKSKIETATLLRYKTSLSERLHALGKAALRENRSADQAVHIGDNILDLVSQCNREISVALTAPEGKSYGGQEIWDIMLCLGLRWGDMDIFHWQNNSDVGGDFFFSVWTSTPPGYFFPEEAAAGRVNVHDLVFGFSLPRSCDPHAVFSSMMQAVKYAQKRLGGKITDGEGMLLDEQATLRQIDALVEQMKKAGFVPGEGSTLRVF